MSPFGSKRESTPLASGVRVQHTKTILGSILKMGDPWETVSIDKCSYDREKHVWMKLTMDSLCVPEAR